jgi:putative ABC transport system permease protein
MDFHRRGEHPGDGNWGTAMWVASMQLVGSTRRQVGAMMRTESVMVVVLAAVLGALIAGHPLIGISIGISGQLLPNVSLIETVAIVGSSSIIGFTSLAVATRAAM